MQKTQRFEQIFFSLCFCLVFTSGFPFFGRIFLLKTLGFLHFLLGAPFFLFFCLVFLVGLKPFWLSGLPFCIYAYFFLGFWHFFLWAPFFRVFFVFFEASLFLGAPFFYICVFVCSAFCIFSSGLPFLNLF
jgi:hypothetical protein